MKKVLCLVMVLSLVALVGYNKKDKVDLEYTDNQDLIQGSAMVVQNIVNVSVERSTCSPGAILTKEEDNFDEQLFFAAIKQVESSGNNRAVGDRGKSRGPYQVQEKFWKDSGVAKSYRKYVWDEATCQVVMKLYWKRYGATTFEEKCRIHNGGPDGMKKPSTKIYYQRVLNEYNRRKQHGKQ